MINNNPWIILKSKSLRSHSRSPMLLTGAILLCLSLCGGCYPRPQTEIVKLLPPALLMQAVPVPAAQVQTNGDLYDWCLDLHGALMQANDRLEAIARWASHETGQ